MKLFPFYFLLPVFFLFAEETPIEEVAPQDVEAIAPSVQEFYSYMQDAIDDQDYFAAIDYAEMVLYHFPDSPFCQEIPYFIGLSYYRLGQHELSNSILSEYLKKASNPKHFDETIEMKFAIAQYFQNGGKKRLFGSHKLPAIMPAQENAIAIYDEIIATLPHHDIAARSLYGKALILAEDEEFKSSIETLQLFIQRFPKNDLTADGYLAINRVYLQQCKSEHLDSNLLDLAEMNLRKFQVAFSREEKLADAETCVREMKEIYANHWLETAHFFEKRNKIDATKLYFSKIIAKYPETHAADVARSKLEAIR